MRALPLVEMTKTYHVISTETNEVSGVEKSQRNRQLPKEISPCANCIRSAEMIRMSLQRKSCQLQPSLSYGSAAAQRAATHIKNTLQNLLKMPLIAAYYGTNLKCTGQLNHALGLNVVLPAGGGNLLYLGIVGCGVQNEVIAQVQRHVAYALHSLFIVALGVGEEHKVAALQV